MEINIERADYYVRHNVQQNERTKKRLTQLVEMGIEEVGVAEFGKKGIVSGLYIEKVWNYDEANWNSYLMWAAKLIAWKAKHS